MHSILTACIALLALVVGFLWLLAGSRRHPRGVTGSVAILVLGDLARSPRMLYHTQSCLRHGRPVWLIGYLDTALPTKLTASPLLEVVQLRPPPDLLAKLPSRLLQAGLKVIWMMLALFAGLWGIQAPAHLLIQNPPSLPTLPLAQLVCRLRSIRLVIDWHNTGASVLALKFSHRHPIVRLALLHVCLIHQIFLTMGSLESTFGRFAHCHLFVTKAMLDHLSLHWKLHGDKRVLYDRPPSTFRRLGERERAELFKELVAAQVLPTSFAGPDRPALVVSSTSWTADEDFTILLQALSAYERSAKKPGSKLPALYAVVTGKGGHLRDSFVEEAAKRSKAEQWQHVQVSTAWLARDDYPRLLGAADLGVSLHSSSSGFDLPMKVVDMFGCSLPVLALDFPALPELVRDGVNGRSFTSAIALAEQLQECLSGFPRTPLLDQWRQGISSTEADGQAWTSWDIGWDATVAPALGIKP